MSPLALVLLLSVGTGATVAGNPGRLVLGGALSHLSDGTGRDAELSWIRDDKAGRTWLLGVRGANQFGSRWLTGRLAGVWRAPPRLTLALEAEVGPGETNEEDFTYRRWEASAAIKLSPQLHLELTDRYLDVAASRGNLARAGVLALPSPAWILRLGVLASTSGNLDTSIVDARGERRLGAIRLIAGLAIGEQRSEVAGLIGQPEGDSLESFVGTAFPTARGDLTLVLDRLEIEEVERWSLLLAWSVSLGGGGR